jgi:hypothetical protein
MEELELFFKGLFTSAFREYGVLGALAVVLAFILLIFLLAVLKEFWVHRAVARAWLIAKYKGNSRLQLITAGFASVMIFSILFVPSSPLISALFAFGCIVLLLKQIRNHLANAKVLEKVALGVLLCAGLTVGGMLHDIAFPPTALCRDGTYSSSEHRSGTCSWHGGVGQWNPYPWWQEIFR